MRSSSLALLLILLAGCGLRQPLEPPPGQPLPIAPALARRTPTPEQLLTPTAVARPQRVDELVRRSEVREEDRFAMPPADVPSGSDPLAEQEKDHPE